MRKHSEGEKIYMEILTDLHVSRPPEYEKVVSGSMYIYCDVLQVILTPTCRVSGYPRQVIKVDAA
jgi:hypothetical protein